MIDATNEARELNLTQLDEVTGGDLPGWFAFGLATYQFLESHHGLSDAINYIKQQAGK